MNTIRRFSAAPAVLYIAARAREANRALVVCGRGRIKNQPKRRLEIYERNVDWFRLWLQDFVDPNDFKREQCERWRRLRAGLALGDRG